MNCRLKNIVLASLILLLNYETDHSLGSQPWCGYVSEVKCPNCVDGAAGGCSCVAIITECRCNDAGYKKTCNTAGFVSTRRPSGYWLSTGPEVLCVRLDTCTTFDGGQCGTYFEGFCEMPPPPNAPCQWRFFVNIPAITYMQSEVMNCPH